MGVKQMGTTAISIYPVPQLSELPKDLQDKIIQVQEKAGFIPNVFLVLAHRPDELRAFINYHDAIMLREGNLTKAEKEMIVVTTSAQNNCLYCVVAHGAILRVYTKMPHIADQLAANYRKADISERQKTMLDFAVKISKDAASVEPLDFESLKLHDFTDEDIWDITAITAFFGLSNRMAHLTEMKPNNEFYSMGR